jgi:4-amino-4-deoxy-L-arabinose transferase-like glycosyltransferase
MVALWTRIFTLNGLIPDSEFFLRFGSVTGCALATWFMYKTVALLHSERAGFFAACLYNASFYAGVTAGIYLMPDAPQMVFWTFSLWMIARITKDENDWRSWVLFGIAAGLCIMSKVHGVFLWGGMGLYMLFLKRSLFFKSQFYVAALITLAITSPILIWNIEYEFATFRFHGGRVIMNESSIEFNFLKELAGQVYFNNPVNFVVVVWGLISFGRNKTGRSSALSVYNFIGLPLAGLLLFISFFRNTTLPHWSGPAYVSLLPLAAIRLAQVNHSIDFPKLIRWALGVFVFVLIGWVCLVNFYPGTVGEKQNDNFGRGDISLDLYGWKTAARHFETIYKAAVNSGAIPAGTPIVCTYWWGAHIEYYFARPSKSPMIGLGPIDQVRHYLWMNKIRKGNVYADPAYCIMPADENYALPRAFYKHIQLVTTITVSRGGQPAHNFKVYLLNGRTNSHQ